MDARYHLRVGDETMPNSHKNLKKSIFRNQSFQKEMKLKGGLLV
jgi:hypothetical protein